MSHTDAQRAIVDKLTAAGVPATLDVRSATPPCVLVPPPDRDYVGSNCGYTAQWRLFVLVPNPLNADTAAKLDELADAAADVLPVERMALSSYVLSQDSPALPAYRIEFDEGV